MKKIIIILICALILPIIVNADMALPQTTSYEVVVSNGNGAQAYDWDGKKLDKIFSYNEKLTVDMEINIDGDLYLSIKGDSVYYIKESDATISGKADLNSVYKSEKTRKLYVFDEGAVLYNGPSIKYGVIENSEIPVGTTLTYERSDDLWAYVNYNGKKGWIYIYPYDEVAPYEDFKTKVCDIAEGKVLVLNESIDLYEKPDDNSNKKTIKIPRNTIVTYNKTLEDSSRSKFIYIKFGVYEGWILDEEENSNFSFSKSNGTYKFMAVDSIPMTEFFDSQESVIVIPKGAIIEANTYYHYTKDFYTDKPDYYYYIEYKGKKGWVNGGKLAEYKDEKLLALKDIDLTKTTTSNEVVGKIKKYDEVDGYYIYYDDSGSFYYIENNNFKGWIKNKGDILAYSSSCNQYFVANSDGQEMTSLSGKKIKAPYQAVLTELYFYSADSKQYSIVEYNGEKYIIKLPNYSLGTTPSISRVKFNDKVNTGAKIPVYETIHLQASGALLFEIPNGEEFDVLFELFNSYGFEYFINYKGKTGWIARNDETLEKINVERKNCLVDENFEIIEENSETELNKPIDSKVIIISCIIGAVTISLASLLIILIINKKRKNKNNNVETAEVKEEKNNL